MNRKMIWAEVISQEKIADDIYDLKLLAPDAAAEAVPGQFVSLFTGDEAHLLPRPISICGADGAEGTLRLVYRIAGYGTERFSHLAPGGKVQLLGPLGNGFLSEKNAAYTKEGEILLVGGGIGIPPMLFLAGSLAGKSTAVLGYRNSDTFLDDEFRTVCRDTVIATDDGSLGVHGTVLDAIRQKGLNPSVIFACGPTPMLKGLKAYAKEKGIPCFISLEERMACGIGACLACVCRTAAKDEHSNVNNARICTEGPVFAAEEVEL